MGCVGELNGWNRSEDIWDLCSGLNSCSLACTYLPYTLLPVAYAWCFFELRMTVSKCCYCITHLISFLMLEPGVHYRSTKENQKLLSYSCLQLQNQQHILR